MVVEEIKWDGNVPGPIGVNVRPMPAWRIIVEIKRKGMGNIFSLVVWS